MVCVGTTALVCERVSAVATQALRSDAVLRVCVSITRT